jgi:hypothetical protein
MVNLNLPSFDYSIKKADGKVWIFDVIRKKFIVLTPEEWVRQHFIHYMINSLKYPKALVKVEGGLSYNQLQKRSDIVVYNREGVPWMIVECKSPDQKLNQQTLQQVSVYNNTLRATYIAVTNGLVHVCCKMDWDEKQSVLLDVFPQYS